MRLKETNAERFKVEESVVLKLELKNVPELIIRVYEFNTETYYKKNMVPFDDKSPFVTSGIRIGTPAITTRGLVEEDMETIVALIDRVLMNHTDEAIIEEVADEVNEMMGERAIFVF